MTKKQLFGWRTLVALVAGAGIATSIASPAWAVLYAYEGFDYTPGSALDGLAGGTGWDLPANDPVYTKFATAPGWKGVTRLNGTTVEAIGADTIQSGSMAYTDTQGNQLVTIGGHLLNTPTGGATATAPSQGGRFLSQRRNSGTTWISFIIQRGGEPDGTPAGGLYRVGANLATFEQYTTDGGTTFKDHEQLDIGPNNSSSFYPNPLNTTDEDRFQLRHPGINTAMREDQMPNQNVNRPTKNTNANNQARETYTEAFRQNLNFFVMRIDHTGDETVGDDVRVWLNPRLDQAPSDTAVSTSYIISDIHAAAAAPATPLANNGFVVYPAAGTPSGGTADISTGDQSFNRLRLFARHPNGAEPFATLSVDEIRIGSTYLDVAPFTPGGQAGDYNKNGRVDAADYVVWREAQLNSATSLDNRKPGVTGAVGPEDYEFWRLNFGNGTGPAAGSQIGAIPEPATCLLVGMIYCAAAVVRRRK